MKISTLMLAAKSTLTNEDLLIINMLYKKIIGSAGVEFIFTVNDLLAMNKSRHLVVNRVEFEDYLSFKLSEFGETRKKLEALGLLKTEYNPNNNVFFFTINKPLTTSQMKRNKIMHKHFVNVLGESRFEQVALHLEKPQVNKEDFDNITVTYLDVFEMPSDDDDTLTMKLPEYTSLDEAIVGLSASQFIRYINGDKLAHAHLGMISRLSAIGLSDIAINEIVHYAFKKNKKIVAQYVSVIGKDLVQKGLFSHKEIRAELQQALEAPKPSDDLLIDNGNSTEEEPNYGGVDIELLEDL